MEHTEIEPGQEQQGEGGETWLVAARGVMGLASARSKEEAHKKASDLALEFESYNVYKKSKQSTD